MISNIIWIIVGTRTLSFILVELFLSVFLKVRSHVFPVLSIFEILFGVLMDHVMIFDGHGQEIIEFSAALLFFAQSLH